MSIELDIYEKIRDCQKKGCGKKTTARLLGISKNTVKKYLDDLFIPAQNWARSEKGISWIAANAPTLFTLINQHYDACLFAVYAVELNGTTLYVGESIRTVRRLIVHAYNIANNPRLFGLERGLGDNTVTFKLLEMSLYDKAIRKATELHYISLLKPLLQAGNGTDNCIPRRKRAAAVAPHDKGTTICQRHRTFRFQI